eukprot:m.376400 g.376400  ORF g.376400 m.376400 type:complete len:289 (+) comp20017_c4_seq6:249-1115(+)
MGDQQLQQMQAMLAQQMQLQQQQLEQMRIQQQQHQQEVERIQRQHQQQMEQHHQEVERIQQHHQQQIAQMEQQMAQMEQQHQQVLAGIYEERQLQQDLLQMDLKEAEQFVDDDFTGVVGGGGGGGGGAAVAAAAAAAEPRLTPCNFLIHRFEKFGRAHRRRSTRHRSLQIKVEHPGPLALMGDCVVCAHPMVSGWIEVLPCGHLVHGNYTKNSGCGRQRAAIQTHQTTCKHAVPRVDAVPATRTIKLHGVSARKGSTYRRFLSRIFNRTRWNNFAKPAGLPSPTFSLD